MPLLKKMGAREKMEEREKARERARVKEKVRAKAREKAKAHGPVQNPREPAARAQRTVIAPAAGAFRPAKASNARRNVWKIARKVGPALV